MKFSSKLGLSAASAALIASVLGGAAVFLDARSILEERIVHGQVSSAMELLHDIDMNLYQGYRDIAMVSNDGLLQELLESSKGNADAEDEELLRELQQRTILTGPWDMLTVMDTAGRNIVKPAINRGKEVVALHPASHIAFEHALKGEVYYSDWVISGYTGRPTVIFAAPVYGISDRHRIVGVVVANYDWSIISKVLDHAGPGAKVHLLNRQGKIIAKPSNDQFVPEQIPLPQANPERTSLANGAGYAIDANSTHGGGRVLAVDLKQAGLAAYRGNGWTLLLEEPIQTLFAPIEKLARDTALMVFGVLLVFAVIYGLIGRRFVRPLKELIGGVQSIARGNYGQRVAVHSSDEFGALAENFNAMMDKLQSSTVSMQYLERINDTMAGSLIVLSPEGQIRMVNQATLHLLGYDRDEIIGRLIQDVIPDCKQLITGHQITEMARSGPVVDVEKDYVTKSGRSFPVLFSASLMLDGEGKVTDIVCAAVDITDRKAAEEKMRDSQSRYRQVFDVAMDMMFTIGADACFTSLNPAFEKVSGWPREQWIGKTFTPLVHPDDLQKSMEIFHRIFRGEPIPMYEMRILKQSGDYFDAEFTVVPLYSEAGVTEVLGIARDITERKEMEKERKRLSEAVRQSHEVVILTDQDLNIAYVNQAFTRLLGYSSEEVMGKSVAMLSVPEEMPNTNPMQAAGFAREKGSFSGPVLRRAKDGTLIPVLISVSAIKDESGNISAYVGTMADMTEIKRAENEIRKLNEELEQMVRERTKQLTEAQGELMRREKLVMLGQIAATVGNELRNPFGVMNNAVYFLKTVLEGSDESVKEYLNIIRNEIAQADRVVSDMVDAAGIKLPHPENILVASIIRQSLDQCTIPDHVKVTIDIPDDVPPVHVDSYQMQQVFRNMITNSVEAMPKGGKIEIRAEGDRETGKVAVSLSDTGIGITPENMTRLFQPLFTTKSRGIGLGLMVARNLVEANGGSVTVESEPGKGTTFTVSMPGESVGVAATA